jgi:hypothetical protein
MAPQSRPFRHTSEPDLPPPHHKNPKTAQHCTRTRASVVPASSTIGRRICRSARAVVPVWIRASTCILDFRPQTKALEIAQPRYAGAPPARALLVLARRHRAQRCLPRARASARENRTADRPLRMARPSSDSAHYGARATAPTQCPAEQITPQLDSRYTGSLVDNVPREPATALTRLTPSLVTLATQGLPDVHSGAPRTSSGLAIVAPKSQSTRRATSRNRSYYWAARATAPSCTTP